MAFTIAHGLILVLCIPQQFSHQNNQSTQQTPDPSYCQGGTTVVGTVAPGGGALALVGPISGAEQGSVEGENPARAVCSTRVPRINDHPFYKAGWRL